MDKQSMYQKLVTLLLTTCVFFSLSMPAAAQSDAHSSSQKQLESLNWVINTAPPFHIVNGPLKGQGICDVLMDLIEEELPELASNRNVLPQTRIRQGFEREQDQCFPCMIYRPEPADTIQSNPTHFYYPHGVIASKEKAAIITERYGNPVRLTGLLTDPEFRFGYPDGRHYPALQSIIDLATEADIKRIAHTGENATVAILSMIKANRIDYTIDYQILHNFDIAEQGSSDLAFLEIVETENTFVLGAVGCTNTEWGRIVIDEINRVLPEVRKHPKFLEVLDTWFRNAPELEPYRELLRKRVWYPTDANQ